MQNVVSMVQSGGGEALLQHAEQRGLDPALLNGVMGIIRWVGEYRVEPQLIGWLKSKGNFHNF